MQNLPSVLTPDLGLLFWMLLAFLVVFLLLAKFGFPAIVKMVEERKRFIDESLQKAREANEKLANIQAESESIIREAREQQAQILKEAAATRESIVEKARDEAKEEGAKILEEAKAQILVEKQNALKEIRGSVAGLSVEIAEQIMLAKLNENGEQEKLIERLLEQKNEK